MRGALTTISLAAALTSCRDEQPLCGYPAQPGLRVTYQVVDATTEKDWFVGPGRTSPDSLRLLPSSQGPGQSAKRVGQLVLVGPVTLPGVFNQGVNTQFLRFSATDVDTIVTRFLFNASQANPCGYGPGVKQIDITYNGRPNTIFRADVLADSLSSYGYFGGRVVQLRKLP